MSANTAIKPPSSLEVKVVTNGHSASSHRKTGTITVKFTAEDAKRFIVSGDPDSKEFKMKLPLKLKLSTDPNDPQAKLKARLVVADQPAKEQLQDLQKIDSKHSSEHKQEELELPFTTLAAQTSEGGPPNALIPIEETGDLFLETSPSEIAFDSPWKSVNEFFYQVIEQLNSNPAFSVLLDNELLSSILLERNRCHLNFEQVQQALSLVFEYMALCKNQAQSQSGSTPLATRLQLRSFAETLGNEWRRLKEEIFLSNKSILKILDYIQPKCEGEGSRYTHCYLNLQYSLSAEEVSRVAEAVKYQCRYNHKAFCFLTNYLLRACRRMEDQDNACIREIEDTLVATISKLIKDNPPSNSLEGEEHLLLKHSSFRLDRTQYPAKTLHLRNVPRDKKIELLENFIQSRARDAQRNSGAFAHLIKDVCARTGSNLTTGVKIKSMRKRRAIDRVKEKVLDGISARHRAELQLNVNPNLSIDDYARQEYEEYRQQLNSIFLGLEESIEFGVDDLLRGRCMFASLDALNDCCQELKDEIPKRGYKLLSLWNRLKDKTCDILLHIRMGETIAELQLVLNYKLAQNEFSAKLDYLRRALFYNHITHLKLYNEKLTYLFLEEALAFVADNTRPACKIDYKEKTDYANTKLNLERFINNLPFKVERAEIEASDIELPMLAAEIAQFKAIVDHNTLARVTPSPQKQKHIGDFLYQLGNYDSSLNHEQDYCKSAQEKHSELLENAAQRELTAEEKQVVKDYAGAVYVIGKIHMRKKNYNLAVQNLQRSEKLIKAVGNRDEYVVETLQHLGEIEYRRGNLSKSIEIYKSLLQFQEASSHPSTEQYTQSLMALALVYQHQGNYYESIKHFQRILPLLEKEKGKEHIQLAAIHNHLGATYNLEGSLALSLSSYKQSLAIIEKEKGRNSIDCASVLANIALIYENDGNYFEAIKYYESSVGICSKHNLKEGTYANAAFGLGKCYSSLKNYSKAIEVSEKAMEYFGQHKGQMYYATITEIAVAYEGLGDDEKASQYYDRLQAQ